MINYDGNIEFQEGVPDATQATMSTSPRVARPARQSGWAAATLLFTEESTHGNEHEQTAVDMGMPPVVAASTSSGHRLPSRKRLPSTSYHTRTSSRTAATSSSRYSTTHSSPRRRADLAAPHTPADGESSVDSAPQQGEHDPAAPGLSSATPGEQRPVEASALVTRVLSRVLTRPNNAAQQLPQIADDRTIRSRTDYLHQQLDGMCEKVPVLDGLLLLEETDTAPRMQGGSLLCCHFSILSHLQLLLVHCCCINAYITMQGLDASLCSQAQLPMFCCCRQTSCGIDIQAKQSSSWRGATRVGGSTP
jgi:hypothetical protein